MTMRRPRVRPRARPSERTALAQARPLRARRRPGLQPWVSEARDGESHEEEDFSSGFGFGSGSRRCRRAALGKLDLLAGRGAGDRRGRRRFPGSAQPRAGYMRRPGSKVMNKKQGVGPEYKVNLEELWHYSKESQR